MSRNVLIIAEAGVNHNGDINKAIELIEKAADAGADIVKFQTFITELNISKQASKAEQSIPLVSRLFDRIAHLPITWKWVPRESPDIVMVDQMGRGLRQDGEKIAENRGA